jgi:hypothetical protein
MTLARADPHLGGTGFDLPPVGNSSPAFSDRFHVRAGNFLRRPAAKCL